MYDWSPEPEAHDKVLDNNPDHVSHQVQTWHDPTFLLKRGIKPLLWDDAYTRIQSKLTVHVHSVEHTKERRLGMKQVYYSQQGFFSYHDNDDSKPTILHSGFVQVSQ